MTSEKIYIPDEICASVSKAQGTYFESILKLPADIIARDMLDARHGHETAKLLAPHMDIQGARILEVGSALGLNVAVWQQHYAAHMTGVEPDGEGFGDSIALSRGLLTANGLDPNAIQAGNGESLPFDDAHFDAVISHNVLEHTDDPAAVLAQCLRVVRPGGIVQVVCPNHLSWFDGHYGLFHPPLVARWIFPAWVRLWGRDPAFARTLRTEINPLWMVRTLHDLQEGYPHTVIDMGASLFADRLTGQTAYTDWGTMSRASKIVKLARKLGLAKLAAWVLIQTNGWTPLIVTLRRL